jgi:hypothetical protein
MEQNPSRKPMFPESVKMSSHFMKFEVSLLCPQETTTSPCPQSHESCPRTPILLIWILFNCVLSIYAVVSSSLFSSTILTKILYAFYFLQTDAELLLPLPPTSVLFIVVVLFFRSVSIVIMLRIRRTQNNFLFSTISRPIMGSIYFLSKGRRTLYSRE